MKKTLVISIIISVFIIVIKAQLILTPLNYENNPEISVNCNEKIHQYNEIVNQCNHPDEKKNSDLCNNINSISYITSLKESCSGENQIEKKLVDQIESTILFNSISNFEVYGINCGLYGFSLGQRKDIQCPCLKKLLEFLSQYNNNENEVLTLSISDLIDEIEKNC